MSQQTQNPVVTLQAQATKTATFNGSSVDISGYPSDPDMLPTVTIKVEALTAAKTAIFELQDSADGFNSDIRVLATFHIEGAIPDGRTPRTRDFHSWEMPGTRYGVTSAHMRLALSYIDSGASVTYDAFIQGNS